jgi:hypothetical protein
MNVEIWTEAAQFPEKEYINGIFVAVWLTIERWVAIRYTVILFSSRYLFPAKSICPTCEQAIQIIMQIRAAAPPNRKLRHIFV